MESKSLSVHGLRVLVLLALVTLLLPIPGQAAPPPVRELAPAPGPSGPSSIYLPILFGPPKSSFELIEEALRAGELDAETALIYQVYATTLDPRLPARYRGGDTDLLESDALREVVRRWDSLSPAAQKLLAPFLTPPLYEGSWRDPATAWGAAGIRPSDVLDKYCWSGASPPFPKPRPGWEQLKTAHTTIWYETAGDTWPSGYQLATPEETEATARAAASVIENIIDKETKLMGERWPLPDTNEPCSGGDGSIDIYITRQNTKTGAQAVPFKPSDDEPRGEKPDDVERPGYIWLAPDYFEGDVKTVRDGLAHEFFHLISMTYPQARWYNEHGMPEYQWLDEATANYMIEYVYHDDQFEHNAAPGYLQGDGSAMGDYSAPLEDANWFGRNGYSDYLYLLFLARKINPEVIRAIWDFTPKFDSLAAVNEATKGAGGFDKLWPEFALVTWNDWQNGFLDDLHDWDGLEPGLSRAKNLWAPLEVALDGKRYDDRVTFQSAMIPHVAMGMSRYVFGDPSVRSVLFTNPLVGERGAHVWALLKIGGQWKVEDWTEKRAIQFCRQLDSERVEDMAIIITNSVFDDREYVLGSEMSDSPMLHFTNIACGGWQGTVTAVHRDDRTGRHDLETIHTTATFEPAPSAGVEFAMYQLKQGTMHWEYTGTLGDCQIRADTVEVALQPPTDGSLSIHQWRDDISLIGQYDGIGTTSYEPTLTYVCPDGSWDQPWMAMPWLDMGSMSTNGARVSADGKTLAGHYEYGTPGEGRSVSVNWNFVAVPASE